MFSRRVFEVLASGTPIISAYSSGIEAMFGSVVHLSRNASETEEFLRLLLSDTAYWKISSLQSQRSALRAHTYAHRLRMILSACDIPVPAELQRKIDIYETSSLATTQEELSATLKSASLVAHT
jgi:spore maturation protein CgeB